MRLLAFADKRSAGEVGMRGNSSRCARIESEKLRQRTRQGARNRVYSKTIIFPMFLRHRSKEIGILENSSQDMSQVPLITNTETGTTESSSSNMVILEAGPPGDTWRYCVERERLAEKSELFRAMLVGPLAPAPSDPPPLLQLQHVEKRAFDHVLRYLLDKPINFQSVSTARATLDAAHQYLNPDLARLAVEYLESNLNSNTVLEIYQGISLYANHVTSGLNQTSTFGSPTAPPTPGDDAGEIAAVCTRLLLTCLEVIDSDPEAVFNQERFEELTAVEVEQLACRDTLRLTNESTLFYALDRWAASECRKQGVELSSNNKRTALSDEVWYSVRYPLMSDREFIEGPMASGILTSEECAFIVTKILGHTENPEEELRNSVSGPLSRLSSTPRIGVRTYKDQSCKMSKPGKKECQDNRKNRRKECANQGQRTCARIGNCLVRVLACIFD
ncbi:BTB/POZ domain-containing protein 1 isoform X7 [Osmia bicornis bicornis]|uniref:BTB/POZ domain-containing protein 1 isoform X7 n=1 Tax=Osmia bicornis bicornis TaxID=1437191 RepID=UPI001EAF2BED|nr:BTB/POZ domain-containing protein 1 isoform X7 [Osmia bicornis bicornis]